MLIVGLVADVGAGTINVSPAVTEWMSEPHARLLPVTEAELEKLMRMARAEELAPKLAHDRAGHS